MKERLVNIFVFEDETHVHAVGWRFYEKSGTYEELVAFLQSRVQYDHQIAARRDLEEPIPWREFKVTERLIPVSGTLGENEIYCVTHVVNGEVRVDDTVVAPDGGLVPDYLTAYVTEGGFDFLRLIHGDHFVAIHLLWNNKKYVSCLKLVFSAIDTFGFIEYGPDDGDCFTKWLDKYCDPGTVGVTSGELWELRNSLIHMTNLDSRKVRSGKTHKLLVCVTDQDRDVAAFVDGMKVLHLARFVKAVLPRGLEKWMQSYNQDREKFADFVERYDTVVSEARLPTTGLVES